MIVLSPDSMTTLMRRAIGRRLEGIESSKYDQQQPGNNGEDLVGYEVSLGEFFALCEWVV